MGCGHQGHAAEQKSATVESVCLAGRAHRVWVLYVRFHAAWLDFVHGEVVGRGEGVRIQISKHPLNEFWGSQVRPLECGVRFFRPGGSLGGARVVGFARGAARGAGRMCGVGWEGGISMAVQYPWGGLRASWCV